MITSYSCSNMQNSAEFPVVQDEEWTHFSRDDDEDTQSSTSLPSESPSTFRAIQQAPDAPNSVRETYGCGSHLCAWCLQAFPDHGTCQSHTQGCSLNADAPHLFPVGSTHPRVWREVQNRQALLRVQRFAPLPSSTQSILFLSRVIEE